jgi:hypothetical protein
MSVQNPPPGQPPNQDPSFRRGWPGRHRFRGLHGAEWGVLLIVVGVIFLLQNFGLLVWDWDRVWPVLLIVIGILLLVRRWR